MRFHGLKANRQLPRPIQGIRPQPVRIQDQQHLPAADIPESLYESQPDAELDSRLVFTRGPETEPESPDLLPVVTAPVSDPPLSSGHLNNPIQLAPLPQPENQKAQDSQIAPVLTLTPTVVHPKGLTVITGYDRIGNDPNVLSPRPKCHVTVDQCGQYTDIQSLQNPSPEGQFELQHSAPSEDQGHRELLSPSPTTSGPENDSILPSSQPAVSSSSLEIDLPTPSSLQQAHLEKRTSNIQVILPNSKSQEQKSGYIERCQVLGEIFKEHAAGIPDPEDDLANVTVSSRALQRFGNTIRIWAPVATITTGRGDTEAHRTFGSIRYAGSEEILMGSVSGWRPGATGNARLLDGGCWSQAVRAFCRIVSHGLPRSLYDGDYEGQFAACHVEKRLGLWFICHHIADETTGVPNAQKLEELKRGPKIEAIIEMDKAPCLNCLQFLKQLGRFTNVEFGVKVAMELGQVERFTEPGIPGVKRRLVAGGCKSVATVKFNTHHLDLTRTLGGRVGKSRMASLSRIPWFATGGSSEAVGDTEVDMDSDESENIVLPLRNMSLTQEASQETNSSKIPEAGQSLSESEEPSQPSSSYRSYRRAPLTDDIFSFDVLNRLDGRRGSRALGSYRNPVTINDSDDDDEDND